MDFAKFDARGKAEAGRAFAICHPETLEPLIEDGKEAKFIVRGNASPSVQEAQKQALVLFAQGADDDTPFTFERLHQTTVDSALVFLAGFENVELNGEPVTMENARAFLNLVFPRVVKNDETGKYTVANKTFAVQVLERAAELDAILGNV